MMWYRLQLLALCACTTVTLGACSGPADLAGQIGPEDSATDTRVHPRPDMSTPAPDAGGAVTPNPPPASCDQRHAGVTGIQVLVRVSNYQGLIHGANGDHEIVYGDIVSTPWVFDKKLIDTAHVQLAMNVHSAKDPSGLPKVIPLQVGQTVEVEGEFIPLATANAHDAGGPAAVIHYTHAPCGYATLGGVTYR